MKRAIQVKIQVALEEGRYRKTPPSPDAVPDETGMYYIPTTTVLTYETDRAVKVGDCVCVPRPYTMGYPSSGAVKGTIVALTSDYDGPCVRI